MAQNDNYYLNTRPELAEFLPQTEKRSCILEIGCGGGNFRQNITVECEYWGIEPTKEAANLASGKLDTVLTGTFSDVYEKLPDNYFDCVICADVIEHMESEDAFLQAIKSKMKKESVLVGSIPNVRYITNLLRLLIWKDWKYADFGILDRTHLRFFTQKSLSRTLNLNGYSIEKFHGINKVKVRHDTFKGYAISIGMIVSSYILGRDTQYLQFGFRVRPTHAQ